MGPGGFPSLQNWWDLTTSGLVGSIPTRSRHAGVLRLIVALTCAMVAAVPAIAQRPDSTHAAAPHPRDTLLTPPISPKAAFLRSLALPAWGQASLGRYNAGVIYAAVEVGSMAMMIQSRHQLSLARRFGADSAIVSFDASGNPVYARGPLYDRVRTRRQQVEDWTAILIFNHLFAGADAFVAANLWDVPARVGIVPDRGGVTVAVSLLW